MKNKLKILKKFIFKSKHWNPNSNFIEIIDPIKLKGIEKLLAPISVSVNQEIWAATKVPISELSTSTYR